MTTRNMMRGLKGRFCQRLFILLSFSLTMIRSEESISINSGQFRQQYYVEQMIHVNEGECEVQESSSRVSCAVQCLNRDNCSAFTYQGDGARCMMCQRQMLGGLDKNGSAFFVTKDVMQELMTVDTVEAPIWPQGTYGLPQPQGGCPVNGTQTQWQLGSINLNTESEDPSTNAASDPIRLRQPIFSVNGSLNYANFHFCMKTADATLGPLWPEGSYCIYKKGDCPADFNLGSLRFDSENSYERNIFNEVYPDFYPTNWINLDLYFCCRNDGPAYTDIALPTKTPFYLFRFGGACQKVKDMIVEEEYIVVDTENCCYSYDAYSNAYHPDGQLDDVRLELCYYQGAM